MLDRIPDTMRDQFEIESVENGYRIVAKTVEASDFLTNLHHQTLPGGL